MVFGYLFVIRANRLIEEAAAITGAEDAPPAKQLKANDIAMAMGGEPVESIIRFHSALRELPAAAASVTMCRGMRPCPWRSSKWPMLTSGHCYRPTQPKKALCGSSSSSKPYT